jgi:hypothetical protein
VGDTFGFGSRLMAFMIFTTFYYLFLTDVDEELNERARMREFWALFV